MVGVALREIQADDHDALFDQMQHPRWVHTAAFTAADPSNREAFDDWLGRLLAAPDIVIRAITSDDQLVGSMAAFPSDGAIEVTYGVHPDRWGEGIATQALRLLLEQVRDRPLHARAASDNVGSLRVLARCGFRPTGTERSFAAGRGATIEETILRLDT